MIRRTLLLFSLAFLGGCGWQKTESTFLPELDAVEGAQGCIEDAFVGEYLIVVYLPRGYCLECVQRELGRLRDENPFTDVAFVVEENLPLLSALKRSQLVRCPLYLGHPSDFGDRFFLSLVHWPSRKMLVTYYPSQDDPSAWYRFVGDVERILSRE